MDKLVSMNNITKKFGAVYANRCVNLHLNEGEVLGILGENGAGKSTLMNVLAGIYQPDEGSIEISGKTVHMKSPREAISNGIGMIHQHLKLIDSHSVFENIIVGEKKKFVINKMKLQSEIEELSQKYGLQIDLNKKIADLSIAEKQRVEILKVLYKGAKVLILDEPTAVLTPQETRGLFDIVRTMKERGCGIIIITHKLGEILEISDRITVLRKGTSVKSFENKGLDPKILTNEMVGEAVDLVIERPESNSSEIGLKIRDLNVTNDESVKVLRDINLDVYKGEILGIAGVAGSGQKELCEAIAGLQKIKSGSIEFKEKDIVGSTPREIIDSGISMSFVPEDRLGMGLVASMDLVDNVLLKSYGNGKGILVRKKPAIDKANDLVEKLSISTPSIETPVRKLSGGNIQKVLLGREIENSPEILITAYAARGLDIGSAHLVYDLLNDQKQKNVAVMFVGEDLDVLLKLCDRIAVFYDGCIQGVEKAQNLDKEKLGWMMAGKDLEEVESNV
ncbi:MAG: ABC transporter ATP-binding protein [Tissierellales bacterium]|jgi:simple sugar transport system ATP-binding protein|nr:ABC transporter ATP-binding protein [Tissierellales bacterium]